MKVGIVAQRSNRRATALATRLFERLHDGETTVVFDETTAAALSADESRWLDGQTATPTGRGVDQMDGCDLVVSIGGDGTFLFAARGAGSTPILGVNLGEVGFLNAVAPDEAVETVVEEVRRIRETGSARTRTVPRLRATGDDWTLPPALNEIVIQGSQRGHGGGAGFEVRVDGSLYTSGHADGVLVATPTGSTAYNLSEDGPLVHPGVDGLVVTEMAGEEAMPPLVVDDSSEITVRIESGAESVVVSDGRVREAVAPPSQVTVARASESVKIAGPQRDFFAALGKLA
ncbi:MULTISPECIES: NAD(+)/NADH kinase [Halomicrobium]|uniref:NAD kinase n=2 Tax=Halomicrobium mukohataei TaxID=57705 RepID=C7P3V4_HALMD|nr:MULTISPECIES: NAD(+)/NADH kinase [Halomicrobium]ACV47776.1 NAD(+) kinase [Halomicrobium mukohataei DSM 12286]QCD66226.1 NAD(+)/NADH kinase [Halomicrobium mukohataei]QFR21032.1 NAD(+) kinase [Halomicrobium sp. ZPS1]